MTIPSSNIFAQAGVEIQNTFSDLTVLSMGLGQDSTTILLKIVLTLNFEHVMRPKNFSFFLAIRAMNTLSHTIS